MLQVISWVYYAMSIYELFLVVYCILSWIPGLYRTKLYSFFSKGADLYLRPFHGLIVIGVIDFTPIIGFLIYGFAQRCLSSYYTYLATLQAASLLGKEKDYGKRL